MIKEPVLAGLRQIRDADPRDVVGAGGDAVEHRFPHMRGGEVDQRDVQPLVPGQRAGQVEPGDAPADDQDAVCVALLGRAEAGPGVCVIHAIRPPAFSARYAIRHAHPPIAEGVEFGRIVLMQTLSV